MTENSQLGQLNVPDGVIIPPPDIREIIEKTADYVFRNGNAFETRIRESESHNNKFNFLKQADPYYPFYEWRLDEYKEGRANLTTNGTQASLAAGAQAQTPVQQNQSANAGPSEPALLKFASVQMPPISAQDLDILRLTALFAARNGRSFLNQLAQREERNFQFDFLRPNHSLYKYFRHLVDQYTAVIKPSDELESRLQENINNKYNVLESAQKRADWFNHQASQSRKAAEEEEEEKIAFAQIDWHDFVVVETIEFTDADNEVELPEPITLKELEHASLEQKQVMSLLHESSKLAIEEAPPDFEPEQEQQQPLQQILPVTVDQSEPSSVPEWIPKINPEEAQRIQERQEALRKQRQVKEEALGTASAGPPKMKIRAAGSSRLKDKQAAAGEAVQQCPRCKEMIPSSEYSEHLRIELLDPRWKEEKAKNEARNALTNLSTSDVAANFKRLASARSDLFDAQGNALDPDEADRQKRR
ncbi:Pre-mRNA splicing factor PRP21 like protein-domain-containing protein [Lipomyces japonicus]|uniref:Pre-mRNA splicing factor PRP21 like protein-domain-containing protein n=1 Tax=Lipomyces japonicus TaxID=56871 RepID=UPI0034CE69D8